MRHSWHHPINTLILGSSRSRPRPRSESNWEIAQNSEFMSMKPIHSDASISRRHGASNHISLACHSIPRSSIARSSPRYNDNSIHTAPSSSLTPSPNKPSQQNTPSMHAQRSHQPEEEDSSNGIVILLGLSIALLSIPWLWSHPESLFIFPFLLLSLPFTGDVLRSALGSLFRSMEKGAGGSGRDKSRAELSSHQSSEDRGEQKMRRAVTRDTHDARTSHAHPTLPVIADMAETQNWPSNVERYRVQLQPVRVEDFAPQSDTASPLRSRNRRYRDASLQPPHLPSLPGEASGIEGGSRLKRSVVAVAPFMADWGGWK